MVLKLQVLELLQLDLSKHFFTPVCEPKVFYLNWPEIFLGLWMAKGGWGTLIFLLKKSIPTFYHHTKINKMCYFCLKRQKLKQSTIHKNDQEDGYVWDFGLVFFLVGFCVWWCFFKNLLNYS